MTDELRFTMRVIRWAPLTVVIALALVMGATLRLGDGKVPLQLVVAILGAIAAAVALSLDDPAHTLLGAVPVSAGRRIALRLVIVGPVAVIGWLLLDALGEWATNATFDGIGVAALVALTATGIAATVAAQQRRPDRAATIGASIALAWALSLNVGRDGILASASAAWIDHAWIVAAAALGVAVLTARR